MAGLTGPAKAAREQADSNADWDKGDVDGRDGTHPMDAGHTHLASRIYRRWGCGRCNAALSARGCASMLHGSMGACAGALTAYLP